MKETPDKSRGSQEWIGVSNERKGVKKWIPLLRI
jgi:hypothetical protein